MNIDSVKSKDLTLVGGDTPVDEETSIKKNKRILKEMRAGLNKELRAIQMKTPQVAEALNAFNKAIVELRCGNPEFLRNCSFNADGMVDESGRASRDTLVYRLRPLNPESTDNLVWEITVDYDADRPAFKPSEGAKRLTLLDITTHLPTAMHEFGHCLYSPAVRAMRYLIIRCRYRIEHVLPVQQDKLVAVLTKGPVTVNFKIHVAPHAFISTERK